MKLHELQVTHRGARPKRHRNPVTSGDRWIRRLSINLPGAASSEENDLRAGRAQGATGVEVSRPHATAVGDDQVDDARVRIDGDAGERRGMPPECAAHLTAGGVAGVQDSSSAVRPLDRQRRLTIRTEVEARAPRHQFTDAVRALFNECAHGSFIAEAVAGGERVGQVKRG
jgi:hypothetical protein